MRDMKKRRAQRIRANVAGVAAVSAIFAAGLVVGKVATAARAAEPQEGPKLKATVLYSETVADDPDHTLEGAPAPYYPLTDEDRALVASVVTAEAGGEDYDGQRLVAQCLLNACLMDGLSPDEAVEEYQYSAARPEPTESVLEAVSAVFDRHDTVTDEMILYFYAPALCSSDWHESQDFVLEHGGHRFFAEADG